MEKKYILVPSYNYGGEEIETSIMQEHIVESDDYILSVEEPDTQYKRVLVPNNS